MTDNQNFYINGGTTHRGLVIGLKVEVDKGMVVVTKTVTDLGTSTQTVSSAPVLKGKNGVPLFDFSGYKSAIFKGNLLAIGFLREVYVYAINTIDAEPLTSDKFLFLREILKDVRQKMSRKGRWNAKISAMVGNDYFLFLTVTHKRSHVAPITIEEKTFKIRMFPDRFKTKDGSFKWFQLKSDMTISELP